MPRPLMSPASEDQNVTRRVDTLWHVSPLKLLFVPVLVSAVLLPEELFRTHSGLSYMHPSNEAGHVIRFPGRLVESFWVQIFFSGLCDFIFLVLIGPDVELISGATW